jgi:hypothetical protein
MKSFIALCVLFFLSLSRQPVVNAFQQPQVLSFQQGTRQATALNVFGNKKSSSAKAEQDASASKYWQGEWVCKDCGYIYNRAVRQRTRA